MGDAFLKLPQLCCRCKNRDIGGLLKSPDLGQFRANSKYRKPPVWVCFACLKKPRRENRQGQESPIEKKVREALQVFREDFVAERKIGEFIYDFAFPRLELLLEVNSYTYHHSKKRKANDAKKQANAEEAGWKLVRVMNGPKVGKRAVELVRARRLELLAEKCDDPDMSIAKMLYEEKYGDGGN